MDLLHDLDQSGEEVLSEFSTIHAYELEEDKNRGRNIELAAKSLSGKVIEPGEEFSFNDTVGERTSVKGYKEATVIFMGMKQKGLGGGICQVSTTLYVAAMLGGLKITQRTPHTRPSTYVGIGMDAAVSYPNVDLKFINTYSEPIYIETFIGERQGSKGWRRELIVSFIGVENPFKNVTHSFRQYEYTPFPKRIIPTNHKKPVLVQKGAYGQPGATIWTYTYADGKKKNKKVISRYKPVPEVWYAKPGPVDAGVQHE